MPLLLLLLLRRPQLTHSTRLNPMTDLITSSSGTLCGTRTCAMAAFDQWPFSIAKLFGPAPWLQASFDPSWRLTGYKFSNSQVNPSVQPPPTAWVASCEKGGMGNTTLVEIDHRANVTITTDKNSHDFIFDTGQTKGCTNVRFDFLGYNSATVPPPVDTAGDSATAKRPPGFPAELGCPRSAWGLRGCCAASADAVQRAIECLQEAWGYSPEVSGRVTVSVTAHSDPQAAHLGDVILEADWEPQRS